MGVTVAELVQPLSATVTLSFARLRLGAGAGAFPLQTLPAMAQRGRGASRFSFSRELRAVWQQATARQAPPGLVSAVGLAVAEVARDLAPVSGLAVPAVPLVALAAAARRR